MKLLVYEDFFNSNEELVGMKQIAIVLGLKPGKYRVEKHIAFGMI